MHILYVLHCQFISVSSAKGLETGLAILYPPFLPITTMMIIISRALNASVSIKRMAYSASGDTTDLDKYILESIEIKSN